MSKKYFVDKDHKIMSEYYDFIDSEERSPEETEKEMQKFIEKDPLFLDPYLILFDLYQHNDDLDKAHEILESAYQKAIKLITDKKGNWPKKMLWGHLENRHIVRTLLKKALNLWIKDKRDDSLELLRKLLRSNPNDNIGARTYILAIRLGMNFDKFEKQMLSKDGYGYDGQKMWKFEKKMKDFPDEFDWWFKLMEEVEE